MLDSLQAITKNFIIQGYESSIPEIGILAQRLGIALLIGLLIGLEREFARGKDLNSFAGARTFPIIALFGFLAAMISSMTEIWLYAVFFISFVMIVSISYYVTAKEGQLGITTELAAILVFILSGMIFWNIILLSAIIAIIMAAILSLKMQIHTFVEKINEEDIFAFLKLSLVTIIILPLLPDRTFGPYNTINFRVIWYMVIFISGISFLGYLLTKFIGYQKGIKYTGIFGGFVSSTALTYAYTKKSRDNVPVIKNYAAGIILACTIVYPKVFIEISVVNAELAKTMAIPIIILTVTGILHSIILWRQTKKVVSNDKVVSNPFELKSALLFGVIFGVILVVSKLSQVYFGEKGVLIVSFISGLPNIDAIVLSVSQLSGVSFSEITASKSILLALLSNTLFKFSLSMFAGHKELRSNVLPGFVSFIGVNLLIILYFYLIG